MTTSPVTAIDDLPYAVDEPPPRAERWFPWVLAVIAIAALAGRIVYVLTLAEKNPTGGDPLYYHVQANLLADGKGFSEPFTWAETGRLIPTVFHPPLFSLVLAASSALGGTDWFAHKLVACVLGTGTVIVVGLVGRQVAGAIVGAIAAVLAAVYPNLWVIDGIGMPESLFGLTIALVVLGAYRYTRLATSGAAVITGMTIGVATLARGEAVFLVALLGLPLVLWAHTAWRVRLRNFVALVMGAAFVIAPWTIHNVTRFDRLVVLSTNAEEVLGVANCPDAYYGRLTGFWSYRCYRRDPPPGDELDRAEQYRRRGIEYAEDHLDRVPYVVGVRLGRIFDVYHPSDNLVFGQAEGRDRRVSRAGQIMFWAMIAPATAGVLSLRRRRVPLTPLLSQIALATVTAIAAYGAIRFRMPAEISLVVLAAVGIEACLRSLRRA